MILFLLSLFHFNWKEKTGSKTLRHPSLFLLTDLYPLLMSVSSKNNDELDIKNDDIDCPHFRNLPSVSCIWSEIA